MNCWGGYFCGNEGVNEWDSWMWSLLHKLCGSTCSVKKGFASNIWPLTKLYHLRSLKLLRDLHIFSQESHLLRKIWSQRESKGGKHVLWDKDLMAHWRLLTFTFNNILNQWALVLLFSTTLQVQCNEGRLICWQQNTLGALDNCTTHVQTTTKEIIVTFLFSLQFWSLSLQAY